MTEVLALLLALSPAPQSPDQSPSADSDDVSIEATDSVKEAVQAILVEDAKSWWYHLIPDSLENVRIVRRSPDAKQYVVQAEYKYGPLKVPAKHKRDTVELRFDESGLVCLLLEAEPTSGCRPIGGPNPTLNLPLVKLGPLAVESAEKSGNDVRDGKPTERDCKPQLFVDSDGRERAHYPCGH